MTELASANTCVSPVYSIPELVQDPHFLARKVFLEAKHAEHGSFRQLGPVMAGGEREQPTHQVAPGSLTDTDALLQAVGMSKRDVEALRSAGVVE